MTTLYLVETNRTLAQRLAAECMMDAAMEYDCVAVSDMNNDMALIDASADGIVVSNISCLTSIPEAVSGSMPVHVYATRPADVEAADAAPYPSYGLMTQPRQLFNAVKKGLYKLPDAAAVNAKAARAAHEPDARALDAQGGGADGPAQPELARSGQAKGPSPQPAAYAATGTAWQPQPAAQGQRPAYGPSAKQEAQSAEGWRPAPVPVADGAAWSPDADPWQPQPAPSAAPSAPDAGPWQPQPAPAARPGAFETASFRDVLMQSREEERRRAQEAERQAFEADRSREQPPAKVVAVTSGKGGVGKTTVATSLAVMLARMEHGRRPGTLSVCLVDYNIDFGNVMATLAMDKGGPNMSHMASDVRERVAKGQTLEYTKDEIRSFLRVHEPSGLHVLCAPETNIDSVYLEYPVKMPDGTMRDVNALSIILDNLRRNGGFDVIVLDTGNSTRDSVYISVKAADHVFVIAEQDVNAAMSVVEFYAVFVPIKEIDMKKFKLVINRVRPAKRVGDISPEEVASYLYAKAREAGGPGMELAATIDMSDDVLGMTNRGKSIVLERPSHQFSQAIGKIARLVHDNGTVLSPKKRGFFSRLLQRGH